METKIKPKKIEVLAPVGINILKTVSHYGADAFYAGLKGFNLCVNTDDLSFGALISAIELVNNVEIPVWSIPSGELPYH